MADRTGSQDEVLAFLADPATHGGQKVRRIDTHASSVFLTEDRALKVKRAVRFPFLDYSTLEKRKAACEAELKVNAPYAPQIYRGVVAITRDAGGKLAVGGSGVAVEWAVEMARFDENCTLDHLAKQIDSSLADALGRVVAAAHRQAQPLDGSAWIEALGNYIDEHADAFRQHPRIFPRDDVDALARKTRAAYQQITPLLRERSRNGFARRIHGDLHLGNIVLLEGKPVLFDAIEFSDIIASGDVLYDLAFLLMDLLERGLEQPANIVLNRYLADSRHAEDLDALAALPFFLSMRAAIRAKVTAARLERAAAVERREIARTANKYFAFALRAIAPPPPRLVAIGGLSGTGKSQLAQSLAADIEPMPGAVVVRSDLERKALFGAAETEKLPASAYTAEVTAPDLCDARRKGAAHPRRRTFGRHRCRVRSGAGARACRGGRKVRQCSLQRAVSDCRSRHPAQASWSAHRGCIRCRRRGRKIAGDLRPRTARLDRDRCCRNTGKHPEIGALGAETPLID